MKRTLCITGLFFMLILSCRNPFFPSTGKPILSSTRREKPAGVMGQLIEAYESKRLDLFEDLLADSFKFYVAHSFESVYLTKYTFDRELPDSNLQFIDKAEYFYFWTKSMEIQSHRKLFTDDDRASKVIQFSPPPEITSTRYVITQDGDTINAELLALGGELLISINSYQEIVKYTVSIEKQVFYLERDAEDLWVIRKWYDLSSAPSLD